MCKQYRQRPSRELDLENDPWIAAQFDEAVWTLGSWIEAELDAVTLTDSEAKDKRRQEILREKRRKKLERLLHPDKRTLVTVAGLAARGVQVVRAKDEK